jgi:hypothetical protein
MSHVAHSASPPEPGASPPEPGSAEPDPRERLSRADAEALGERIQQQAALIAEATCDLLELVSEFDGRGGTGWYVGLKSTAHWLAWACSMSPGTAREHVRVARALPAMPLTVAEFRAGRLSYSKVREITRVAGRVEEELLVEMARAMTASQLARAISSFRAVEGSRLGQDAIREARWRTREDGMVEVRAVLPPEIGAEVVTALELAVGRDGHESAAEPSDKPSDARDPGAPAAAAVEEAAGVTTTPLLEQRRADALHQLARTYLGAEPDDRSGEDRHLVIVQVSAGSLPTGVPAGTPGGCTDDGLTVAESAAVESAVDDPADGVPAGTSPRCGVVGQGRLEARTAERLACTGKVAMMVTDVGGEVLHLGRSRRLASRAQRRALRLRDATCTFPGCHQSRHLDAHHTTPWSEGGLTDIEGLALLCRRHHVLVHEGGLRLAPVPTAATASDARFGPRFQVLDCSGSPVQARWPAMLEHVSTRPAATRPADERPAETGSTDQGQADQGRSAAAMNDDPTRIAATTGGAGFRLADVVDALCLSAVGLAA